MIVPDFQALKSYAEKNSLPGDIKTLVSQPDIQAMISKEILDDLKKKYGGYEIPRKFIYLTEPFTLENGMVTQTMKLKRRVIMEKYQTELDAMYKK
jgi:long-chain acyl-CoA synthetase